MSLAAALREHAATRPGDAALIVPARPGWRTLSCAQVDALVDGCANDLGGRGLGGGDRVLVLVKPGLALYGVLLGLLRLGAIPVLVDPGMGLRRVLGCVREVRPRGLVGVPAVLLLRRLARRSFASVEVAVKVGRAPWGGRPLDAAVPAPRATGAASAAAPPAAAPVHDADALIAFTSGSTGPPKGVRFTHATLAAQARLLGATYGWRPGERIVLGFAAFGLHALAGGHCAVLPDADLTRPARTDPGRFVAAIEAHGAASAFASPAVWHRVVGWCRARGRRLPGLRQALTAGAPVPTGLHAALRDLLPPGGAMLTPYGATEALPLTSIGTDDLLGEAAERAGRGHGTCVGRPLDGIDLRIMRITDDPVPRWTEALRAPPGEIGEVVAGGPVVSPGYAERPDADAAARLESERGPLHRMGDLGYLDEQGRLWFCGRKAHRIETPAGMVPSVPVENVLDRHPAVRRAALVGIGRPGEAEPVACLVLEPGARLTPRLAAELVARLDGTAWAGRVRCFLACGRLPVDARHNAKIRRGQLAARAARRLRRAVTAPEAAP